MEKPLVMVVDDEKDVTDDIAETISRIGKYEAIKAFSGEEALKIIQERNKGLLKKDKNKVKLVLLDIRMSGMDGIETLEKINEIDEKVGVIMVTAYGLEEYWMKSIIGSEAMAFITKPFDNEKLTGLINDFFSGKKEEVAEKYRNYFWQQPLIDQLRKTEERIKELEKGQEPE